MTREELLPCPFCGSKVALSVLEDDDDTILSAWVDCSTCGAAISERRTEAEATALWNRRVPGVAQSAWQPIETAPKDGTSIMLGFWYQGRFAQYQAFYSPDGWAPGWLENSHHYHPDHFQKWFELWHPLPAPPSNQGTSK